MTLIDSVAPGDNYSIAVCMLGEKNITINLSSKVNTCRFKRLVNKDIFYKVRTDGMFVIWNNGEIKLSVGEIINFEKANIL